MTTVLETPVSVAEFSSSNDVDYAFAHSDIAHNSFKKLRLQKTFDLIAQSLIVGFVCVLVYYNWLMLVPHLTPLFWALLFSVALYRPLHFILDALHFIDERLADIKLKLYLTTAVVYVLFLISSSLLTIVTVSVVFALWTFFLFGERQSVGAVLILAILCVAVGMPAYYTVVTCVNESTELATKIQHFVEENPEFHTLLDDFGSSTYYLWARDYAQQWGVEIPAYDPQVIKDKIIAFSMQFTSQITQALGSIVGVLSSGVQFLVSFITFASSLYYFLINLDIIMAILPEISPFSDEDSIVLMNSLHRSVTQIFISSFLIFIAHLTGTWMIFTLLGVDLTLVLSVLAGFTSMLPIIGSYIIWVPIALGKLAYGQPIQALAITIVQLILQFPVDILIYSIIPGNSFLLGFALAMGMYLFGFIGIVFGPLLAGILITVINMYAVYQRMPRLKLKDNTIEVDVSKINETLSLSATPSIVGTGGSMAPSLSGRSYSQGLAPGSLLLPNQVTMSSSLELKTENCNNNTNGREITLNKGEKPAERPHSSTLPEQKITTSASLTSVPEIESNNDAVPDERVTM